MCGRFTLHASTEAVQLQFKVQQSIILKPRFNIAPQQYIPVMTDLGAIEFMVWGFLPSWIKPDSSNDSLQDGWINARAESLDTKSAFKYAFRKRRCIVIASGYYEWKIMNNNTKQPVYFHLKDNKLLALAGLWEPQNEHCKKNFNTAAIITVESPIEYQEIHNRMPLILQPEDYEMWLNPKTLIKSIKNLMVPKDNPNLVFYPVSTVVNNPKADFESCILPLH